jgi:nucleotide-binding universal stress UspA family protein
MMFYKTILVHVDESRNLKKHVELAAKLAVRFNAHLIGIAATGSPHLLGGTAASCEGGDDRAAPCGAEMEPLRQRAKAALDTFETLARAVGATCYGQRLIDDDAAVAVTRAGLYADLIVLGQGDPDAGSLSGPVDFPEYVVLNSACPVLIVSRAVSASSRCERALVAWNGSRAAARAIRNALPLLQEATRVQVAVIDTSTAGVVQDAESASGLIAFLASHDIVADMIRRTVADDAGHGLLSLATELGCDVLVMGCVGHLHTRSMTLGGATRVVLESATIPIFMSP